MQGDVLRIAGRARKGLGWKDERVKIVLNDVVHARIKGTRVDLWLRTGTGRRPAANRAGMFTPEAAGELVGWLPGGYAASGPEPGRAGRACAPA